MEQLSKEEAEHRISQIETNYGNYVVFNSWMGIEISWERKSKRNGGNTKRKGNWGNWQYRDIISNKDLTRDEAIREASRPMSERVAEADLTKIVYCIMCSKVAIGEEEILRWGNLQYTWGIKTYSTGWEVPLKKWGMICGKCCSRILSGEFRLEV